MTIAVELKNLCFGFHSGNDLFNQINWQMQEGQFFAVVGPNGGGKTTLLKLIAGFSSPCGGSVELFGAPPHKTRRLLGYVPQSLLFDRQFPITTKELVAMGLLDKLDCWGRLPKSAEYEIKEVLDRVGIVDQIDQPFGDLSGGQRQRALLARALIAKPRILLLDEPTASVDAEAEEHIYQILQQLRRQMTLLMVTHELEATVRSGVDGVLCVQRGITLLDAEQLCQHYSLGIYHPPLQLGSSTMGKGRV